MASFAQFLGRKVTVQYRVGDVLLPASGTLAADSGRSIFLEQHVEHRGKRIYFRWEIPYRFFHRIEEAEEPRSHLRPPRSPLLSRRSPTPPRQAPGLAYTRPQRRP